MILKIPTWLELDTTLRQEEVEKVEEEKEAEDDNEFNLNIFTPVCVYLVALVLKITNIFEKTTCTGYLKSFYMMCHFESPSSIAKTFYKTLVPIM